MGTQYLFLGPIIAGISCEQGTYQTLEIRWKDCANGRQVKWPQGSQRMACFIKRSVGLAPTKNVSIGEGACHPLTEPKNDSDSIDNELT